MNKKCLLYIVLFLCFGIGVRAGNTITISSTEGAPGDEVTVSIGLTNSDAVSTLQLNIPLDENVTFVENSGQKGSRCSGHSLSMGVKDGELNIVIWSYPMKDFTGNSGEVASFRLKLGNQPSTISLTPSKTVLTSSSGQPLEGTTVIAGDVIVLCAKAEYSTMEVDFGEVPILGTYEQTVTVTNTGNDNLTITALSFSDVNVFSSTTSLPLTVEPGNTAELNITYKPKERGNISRTLKVVCNSTSKLNTIALKAKPFAVNELHVQDASGIADEEVTVSMTLNNMDPIIGWQVDFELPDELEYVDGSFEQSDRSQDHQFGVMHNGQKLTLMAYSMTGKSLTGNDGEIASFKVKLVGRNGVTLEPVKTMLTATVNGVTGNVVSAVYGGYINIQSPQINCDDTFDFGAVPITEACERPFTVHNYGSAPLTISRVVFNNDKMSIKESLPLVIPAGESKALTVAYNSVEQTAFEGTMNIYSNDPDLRMKSVLVSGSRFAPNFLAVSTSDIDEDGELKIHLSIDNYDAISGLQFELEYPSQYYEPYADNYELTTRAKGMTVTSRNADEKTLRYVCYFYSKEAAIASGEGRVLTIKLRPKTTPVPMGSYSVSIKNVVLGTSAMDNKYSGGNLESTFQVRDILIGDVNNDGKVTITDAVGIVNYILGNPSDNFNETAADVNHDGKITITDAVGVVNIILNSGGGSSAPKLETPQTQEAPDAEAPEPAEVGEPE